MTFPAQADPADSDAQLVADQLALELAARDLYDSAIAAGAADAIWTTLREQHDSFAQRLSGIIAQPAQGASDELADQFADGFAVADPSELAAQLENHLAATYADRVGEVSVSTRGNAIAGAFGSILVSESRHAVVLSDMAGVTDPAGILVNPIAEVGA